jgi:hypothetical protein
MLEEHATLLYL